MDKAGKYSVRPSVVIAAVIACVFAAATLWFPELPLFALLYALLLSFFALLLFPVGMVLDRVGGKSPRASLVSAAVIAGVLYVMDAFVLLSEVFDYVLFGVALLYFLPTALWALRTDRRVAKLRAAKAGIYLFAAVSIVATIVSQNHMADRRAVKLGDACLAYRAKYQHYPQNLNALVPEFISSVPAPRYALVPDRFTYFPRSSYSTTDEVYDLQNEPMLYYQVVPPFGRRFYHMESRERGFLD